MRREQCGAPAEMMRAHVARAISTPNRRERPLHMQIRERSYTTWHPFDRACSVNALGVTVSVRRWNS